MVEDMDEWIYLTNEPILKSDKKYMDFGRENTLSPKKLIDKYKSNGYEEVKFGKAYDLDGNEIPSENNIVGIYVKKKN